MRIFCLLHRLNWPKMHFALSDDGWLLLNAKKCIVDACELIQSYSWNLSVFNIDRTKKLYYHKERKYRDRIACTNSVESDQTVSGNSLIRVCTVCRFAGHFSHLAN